MNPKLIKEILRLSLKLYNLLKENRLLSLLRTGLMLMIFYMCFNEFYLRDRFFQEAKRTNIISEKIGNIVRECGENSFVSWLTVEDNGISASKKRMTFNQVVGCVGEDNIHCPVSVKYSNPAYLKDYYIGYDDFDYLTNLVSGMIVKCNVEDDIKCPEYTPVILRQITQLTNLKLTEVNYVAVKDWKRNIVYIFTLSFARNSINTCSTIGGNMLLDNLARTAMENL